VARDWFVTLFFACLDPRRRSLAYCSAGHCAGYVLDRDGRVKAVLPGTDIPLGIDTDTAYATSATLDLAPGDLLFVYSDGIVDAFAAGGRRFGLRRALELVRARRAEPPDAIVGALFRAVREFSGDAGAPAQRVVDDMTAVVLKVVSGEW
jgi:sigma-B regulation protein RsbU (phosphoserine phosphatase)